MNNRPFKLVPSVDTVFDYLFSFFFYISCGNNGISQYEYISKYVYNSKKINQTPPKHLNTHHGHRDGNHHGVRDVRDVHDVHALHERLEYTPFHGNELAYELELECDVQFRPVLDGLLGHALFKQSVYLVN